MPIARRFAGRAAGGRLVGGMTRTWVMAVWRRRALMAQMVRARAPVAARVIRVISIKVTSRPSRADRTSAAR